VFSTMSSAKTTVLRGVDFWATLLLRLMAARVMSCSCRPELESLDDPCVDVRGVKKRVNRFGVMGGGFLMRPLVVAGGAGGDELGNSDRGSISPLRAAQGEDIFATRTYIYTSNWGTKGKRTYTKMARMRGMEAKMRRI
jgi:hypothetical protein